MIDIAVCPECDSKIDSNIWRCPHCGEVLYYPGGRVY